MIGVPADTTVECSSVPAPAVVTFEDNCAFDLNVELAVSSPVADECGYHFTRTWSVQDYCGNVATATQVVTVRDTTDPVFTSCPQGGDLGCNPEEIPAAGGAIATDNCGEPTIVVLPGDIVADGCYRSFTRTYKAYDSCGNDAYCYQTFTWTVDTQDPAFTLCPTAVNLGCNPTEIPFSETLEATDNCGIPVVTYTTSDLSQDGCFHSQTRYFTATDACCNTSTCAQTFTWTVDHNDPYFAYCPQGGDLGCNPEEIPFSTYAVALDSCGLPTLTFSDSDVVVDGCFRSQTRTFLAVDACGNSTTCDQTFVWTVDTEDPTLNNVPDDIIGQCSEIPLPSVVTGSDNCDSDVFVDYDEEQLSEFCPVTIIRTWTAYDNCGNSHAETQTIVIEDTIDPILIGVPADTTVECSSVPAPAVVTFEDNCAFDLNVELAVSSPVADECGYHFTRTWSVIDYCGNSATASQVVTVRDTELPTANRSSEEIYVECDEQIPAFDITWTDNCDDTLEVQAISGISMEGCGQVIYQSYFAEDDCGNVGVISRTIHITDSTPPVIIIPMEDQVVQCDEEITYDETVFTDNCDDSLTITYTEDTLVLAHGFIIHRHYTATDDCGNSITDDADIIVLLENDPILIGIPEQNVVIECGELEEPAIVFGTDYCGNELDVDFEEDSLVDGCLLIVTRIWTVTDSDGNSTSFTQTIQVGDTTPPTIVCPNNYTVACSDDVMPADISSVIVDDNCAIDTVLVEEYTSDYECVNRYQIHRIYTVYDECGNNTSCEQIIFVNDETAPVFTYIPQGSAGCSDVIDFGMAEATDNCGGEVTITWEDYTENNSDTTDCQYLTYSKGGWGSPSVSEPGSYRDANFDLAFPDGLVIGCDTGSYTFTSAQAIENFLPSGGGASVLPEGNTVNPTADNTSNNFADQLVAATLNVTFDLYDPNFGASTGNLGDLEFAGGVFAGMTANEVIAIANNVIGGCSNAYAPVVLLEAMEAINLSFHEGNTNSGALLCGEGENQNVCEYSVTRVWTAEDECGNTSTATTVISVSDTEDPEVVYAPQDVHVQCNSDVVNDEPEFTDNCDTDLTITPASSIVMTEPCGFLIHKSWTATDNCGNSITVTQNITVRDTIAPTLYGVPNNVEAECGQLPPVADVQAFDNCDDDVLVEFSEEGTQDGCYYNLVRTWTATDNCGNTTSASQIIVVGDNTDPWIVAAPSEEIWVECDENVPALEVLFDDNCDDSLTYTAISTISAPLECGYDISRAITATDDCGNSISFGQVVHVRDTQDPQIEWVAESITIDCEDEIPAMEEPIFTDNCDDSLVVLPASSIVTLDCGYAIHRTWTATDDCGNSVTAVQNITITDTEAPVIDPYVIYQHVECEESFDFTGITAHDNCGEVHITFTDDNFSGGCPGVIVRTYTVSDDCGNEAIAQQIISLQDTHGPVIENPADETVECQDAPMEMPEINIYDHCSEVTILEATQEIVIIDSCSYQIIWHWVAQDYCENISEATTVITVTDTTAPSISNLPESMTFECNESFDAPAWPTITDNCMDTPYVEYSVDTMSGDCPYSYDVYYTWRAYDNCENETVEFVVYHVRDTQGPIFGENQSEFSYECDEDIALVQPLAEDNCGTVSYDHYDQDFWSEGCNNGFTRVWVATDECDNNTYFYQYINIYDETAPEVTGEYELTLLCDEFEGIYITATDNCHEVIIDHNDVEVSGSCAGRYMRTYIVSDECGNTTEFVQIINLIDETDPTVVVPATDIQVECGDEIPAFEPVFADNCDDSLIVNMISAISYSEDGCTTYISQGWTATDDCNNTVSTGRTITITDTTDPEFDVVPQDENYSCTATIPVAEVTASDICDQEVEVNHNDVIIPGTCPNNYTIERTWTAEDNCGNLAEYVQHIYVTDDNFPVFTYVPGPSSFSCEDEIVFGAPIAEDLCSEVTYDHYDTFDYECNNTYTVERTWIATDACGNSTSAISYYSVYDNLAPAFDQELTDVTVQCASDIPSPVEVTATDNCGTAVVSVEVLEVESDTCGNQVLYVQYIAHDDCDNINYTGYYITVNDDVEPVLDGCPDDIILSCDQEIPAPAMVTVTDNCDQDITVGYEEFFFGDVPTEGSIADCNLLTPIRPAGNPCSYPYDWAMAMFGMPTAHRYYTVHEGSLVRFPNGTAHLVAELRNAQNAANGWNIDVWFGNEMDWSAWSSQGFPTNFKADCGSIAANHFDWLYFIMQAAPGAELVGFGGYAGSSLNLVHAPSNHYFGFQLGDGANNYNAADNGFGGWFSYNGYFQVNQVPFGNNNGTVSGAGDLAFELDCCPQYHIIRQWTASDCSGNSVGCSQMISFSSDVAGTPGVTTKPSKLDPQSEISSTVLVSPNPTSDNTLFTFTPALEGKTTLEIYDLAGKKVADVFIGVVEAGVEYKVDYNVNSLATGVYMYRLTNAESKEVGRIVVNH
ncbi:MAG: T9SS type A sorting domain-containing protein [Flavobacteriales bacterium]|nr:T9SS type A sorting domain-containing protein [Flavobacteriales bacterium]